MRFFLTCVLFGVLTAHVCLSIDSKESESELDESNDKKGLPDLGDLFVQPMKGFGDWFKNAGEEVKERSESGLETLKEFSNQAREKSEGVVKGFSEGIGERFNKAKDKLEEHGEKVKEALTNAAEKTKDEFETASSKISKHAKDTSEFMFSMFG